LGMSVSSNQSSNLCGRCRRRFGRSWAKNLANEGKFVFWVNEQLIPLETQETHEDARRL
jgi:hypothetical protein